MNIFLNKLKTNVDPGSTLDKLLDEMSIKTKYIAIEVNKQIIPKSEYKKYKLKHGDKVEIVTAIGGG